eukprot:gb/GECH01008069.1/.p1 GENE.gb/GECH01008069.1/~~gb/GECH01008069.1/.p1  ORF type:complete len:284 (+),score=74.55 gb/GECH01008069.1/:1-852(+)
MIRSTTKSTLSTAAITKTDQHQQNYRKIYSTARSNYYNKIISHDSLKVPSSQFSQIQTFHKNINLVNNTQPCLSISVHRNYSSISTGWLKLQGNTNNLSKNSEFYSYLSTRINNNLFNKNDLLNSNSRSYSSSSSHDEREKYEGVPSHIPRHKVHYKFSRSSGPGGQNVNKLNTKVDIRFHVREADWLPDPVKDRIHELFANKINVHGELMVSASEHRTQKNNMESAISKLNDLVHQAAIIPKERKFREGRTKKGDEERLKAKKRRSEIKSNRKRKIVDSKFD